MRAEAPDAAPRPKRVLVLCPSVWDKEGFPAANLSERYDLLFAGEELLDWPSLWSGLRFDVFRYVRRIAAEYGVLGLDGVVGTGDYPACFLASAVAEELSLRAPRTRDVVLLSHKYYSREIQARHVPEATPAFAAIDPRRGISAGRTLACPFFIKPVKGTMSMRARSVRAPDELRGAIHLTMKERLLAHLLLRPFQQLLDRYSDGRVPAHFFVGEGLLEGEQVTVDGFVQDGKAVIMGVVDSVMYPGTTSFRRFDYPSALPLEVQARMSAIAARLIEGSGFDHACFNIEMFYNPKSGAISVIEVNPRMSYQFADLYERVDGTSTYEVQLALSTGARVRWSTGRGRDGVAASCVLRRFSDARVTRVPSEAEIASVAERFSGATVKVLCRPGRRLSGQDQDIGSYRYCIVNLGAPIHAELLDRFAEIERMLTFGFE